MDFFNKYRGLFGVHNNTQIPQSRLSINNNLFIDKPFIPTYTESYSINSKLRALKKDYDELQEQMNVFDSRVKTPTPKRLNSRKGKQLRQAREIDMNAKNVNSSFHKHDYKDPLQDKRGSWLKDEQKNLLKHSEIDHVFNHQIYEEKSRVKNVRQSNIPKAENFLFGQPQQLPPRRPQRNKKTEIPHIQNHSQSLDHLHRRREPRQQQRYQPKKNNRNAFNSQKQVVTRGLAQQRRDESKRNLRSRREKLAHILRTSW